MATNKAAPQYSAAELIRAASGMERDVLTVVLEPGKSYTKDETKKLCQEYLARGGKQHVRR